jgi:predicted phage terminase large subunit-like protein
MAKRKTAVSPVETIGNLLALPAGERGQAISVLSEEQKAALIAQIDAAERDALAELARTEDNPESFAAFYKLVHGKPPPPRAMKEWIEPVYRAHAQKKGTVVKAFRGSTKTTTVTITFAAYRIGKEPHRANLLIQVGDDIAADNTAQIADIIANNPGWKTVFPGIIPDRERGWGAGGYEVKDDSISYPAWREKNAARKDPSLVGVGYKSREIIGKHPDGVLVIDDINDENNTSSERELSTVRTILTGTIFPTMTPDTWTVFIGTPWVENDVLSYVEATGEFVCISTPVYREEDGERVLWWPEKFGWEEIERQRRLAGTLQFARMFLLDLSAARNRVFRYQSYPSPEIRYNWPMVGGCDYASSGDAKKNAEGRLDYFALAYAAKLPGGGAVVVDGVIDHCTQGQAEIYLNRAQEIYPGWITTAVEKMGKGDDFVQVLGRNPFLRIIPMTSGRMKKERRLEIELGPWLENGAIKISDADTPFLRELRAELDAYPNHAHDDALDALYYAMRAMPDVLTMPADEDELPAYGRKKKPRNPFAALGRA